MAYPLNAAVGVILAWVLYRLWQELVRSLKTGTWQGRRGGWTLKGVVVRRHSEPVLYWMCMVALAAGVLVFALLLGSLVWHWM